MATDTERLSSSELADLLPAIETGDRLRRTDCLRLWQTDDLTSLGVLANRRRELVSGDTAYIHPAMHLNSTGLPVPACPECNVASTVDGSALSPEAVDQALMRVNSGQAGELHMAGGPHSGIGLDGLCRLVERAVSSHPQWKLRAFTWQELEHAAAKDGRTPAQALAALVSAGLASLVGGALADLSPDQPHLCSDSISMMERRMPWIQAAADLGLKCELCWVFGDNDDQETLTDTLVCIRGIQDYGAIFECFAPLAFRWHTDTLDLPMPTGYNHLRAVAIGRLFLDNIARIRSSPHAVGEPLAQVAQWYGADDAGGFCAAENSGAQGAEIRRDRMSNLLREAGREPVEL
jgi:aminodeoxyfutalosine synthase